LFHDVDDLSDMSCVTGSFSAISLSLITNSFFDFTLESAAEQEANSDERVADNLVKWK
jgi:hypothetical protein